MYTLSVLLSFLFAFCCFSVWYKLIVFRLGGIKHRCLSLLFSGCSYFDIVISIRLQINAAVRKDQCESSDYFYFIFMKHFVIEIIFWVLFEIIDWLEFITRNTTILQSYSRYIQKNNQQLNKYIEWFGISIQPKSLGYAYVGYFIVKHNELCS